MKAKIELKLIHNHKPSTGYIVFYEDITYVIVALTKRQATLKKYDGEETIKVALSELSSSFIKFVAIANNTFFSVAHGVFHKLIKNIKDQFPDLTVHEVISKLVSNETEVFVHGTVNPVYTKVKVGDSVEINHLATIDKYNLFGEDKHGRIAEIIEINEEKDDYVLENDLITTSIKRSHFTTKDDSKNVKYLFNI